MTTIAVLLVLLGVSSRLLTAFGVLPFGATMLGAVCLYAGARLPRRWSIAVPLVAMLVSDFLLDAYWASAAEPLTRLTIYATFALMVVLGRQPRFDAQPAVRAGLAVVGSTLFYITTNFAVWLANDTGLYPMTLGGLSACYAAALPFYRNMLVADLVGTAALFSLDALCRRAIVAAEVDTARAS